MLEKKAYFKLCDLRPLNKPLFKDNLYRDFGIEADAEAIAQYKTASAKSAELESNGDNTKFDLEAEIKGHPDSLFVKCFAIKADEMNDNGDFFSQDELIKATPTFVGVPVFTNHQNSDINQARGKVVHSWWDPERNGIAVIARVDAEAYPQLARGIKEEYIVGCFPGDAPVLMENGTEKPICDIEDGDYVISHTGKSRRVLGKRSRGYKFPLYSIKLEGLSQPIICTAHHNLISYRLRDVCACGCGEKLPEREDKRITSSLFNRKFVHGHNSRGENVNFDPIQKIKACELKVGDFLFESKIIDDSCDDFVTEDQAFLIGLFLAEGSFEKREGIRNSVIFNFSHTERDTIASHCIDLLSKVFIEHRNNPTMNWYPDSSQTRVCLYGKEVAEWFFRMCGEYSESKKIHTNLLRLGKKKTASLLAGYMEGDGYNVRGKSYGAATVSADLASQIRLLSQKLGIRDRYRTRKNNGKWGYKLVHEVACGLTTANVLREHLVFKQADLPQVNAADWHSLENITLRRITAIEEKPFDGLVYDLEVDEDHSYSVNHISVSNTSMGCQVKYSLCSICHNKAETPDQYCEHIRERKTRQINARSQKCSYHKHGDQNECPICGSTKDQIKTFAVDSKAFEYNYGIKFIENSFVVNPACHECGVTEIIDPQVFLQKVSAISSILPKLLKAASNASGFCDDNKCVKLAGQKEIGELNQALDLLTSVSQSMLQQKEQIDLEFLSDLVTVLADLQTVTDELTEQGYGRLQSPGGEEQSQPNGAQPGEQQPSPGEQQVTHAVNPTPGGGSKIQSGPAGNVGTVTSPTGAMAAKKQLNLEKTAKGMFKNKTIDLRIPPILRGLISHSTNRLLDLQFKMSASNELSIPFKMTRNIK